MTYFLSFALGSRLLFLLLERRRGVRVVHGLEHVAKKQQDRSRTFAEFLALQESRQM